MAWVTCRVKRNKGHTVLKKARFNRGTEMSKNLLSCGETSTVQLVQLVFTALIPPKKHVRL